jgi:DNA-binding winged helix-turn-helix (wHTH) protein
MSSPGSLADFGDFTFDASSGELHGPAGTSRLPPRVAGLLALLIGNAGSVVARSDLQAALWPTTTVEFDDGLNACVRQLRIALNDDASTPRYIETLPRRGYRFIAAVNTEAAAGTVRDTDGPVTVGGRTRRPRGRLLATCVIAGIVLAIGLAAWLAARPHSQRTSPIVVAFAPFDADTMDPPLARYRERVDSTILRIAPGATAAHLRLVGVDIARPIERTPGTARTVNPR